MSKIRILPEQLANQIAAGEVVERPASVVKELLENAIDAGARHVTVEIDRGPTRLIRIIDDGEGMDQDDVLLALERHATSKLASAAQLDAIRTLGFRGEAIPSIASVSRLTITSRTAGAELGTRVEVRFGEVSKVHECGCPQGTVFEVRDLFGNVPARRKFLKTTQTELFHVEEAVRNYSLAYPGLGIRYLVNGREVVAVPAGDSLEERLRRLLGRRLSGPLIEIASGEGEGGASTVSGFLAPPDQVSGGSARLRIFVNGRPVRDRMIGHGVNEGLRGFVMKGRQPAGVLFLEAEPASVDVNVHPTKQEVRFRNANAIHQLVQLAVERGMARFQENLRHSLFGRPPAQGPEAAPAAARDETPEQPWRPADLPIAWDTREPAPSTAPAPSPPPPATLPGEKERPGQGREAAAPPEAARAPADSEARWQRLRPIGQLLDTYILCETGEGLLAIDQHAAHERLLYETLKSQYRRGRVARQALLFPKMVECGPEEAAVLRRFAGELEALGLDIEEFGGASYVIKAIPAMVGQAAPEEILADFVAQFGGSERQARVESRIEALLATMACKAAIKAGRRLAPEEIADLLEQMRRAGVFSHCPHGRPVAKHFDAEAIRRWFHRT